MPSLDKLTSVANAERLPRFLTNDHHRVYGATMDVIDSAYALGDAADNKRASLPTTAEVACQKAEYLDRALNDGFRGAVPV